MKNVLLVLFLFVTVSMADGNQNVTSLNTQVKEEKYCKNLKIEEVRQRGCCS
ncbi:MAG: hypothetical protein PHX13_00935 [Thiovulaceae bacterium]|nr:hypothetical protein [Sulfurimonadaceae bacterium]